MSGLLYLAPWFVLIAAWVLARRTTEDLIVRIAGWRPPRRRASSSRAAGRAHGFEPTAAQGGLLVGLCLAVRGPPAVAIFRIP
ncbi:MAG: hypothetical protein BGO11_19035 [Solirubrobacterales bacterium 70-9]|nr:MAG: hypothetical protein BGO11_19035 [Solirubrobacterales bacterium 70-9]